MLVYIISLPLKSQELSSLLHSWIQRSPIPLKTPKEHVCTKNQIFPVHPCNSTVLNGSILKPFNKKHCVFKVTDLEALKLFFYWIWDARIDTELVCMKQARPKATQPGLIWKWKPLPAQRSSACCLLWCIHDSGVEWCLRVKQSTTQTVMDWCHNFICRTPHFVQSWSESYSFDVFTHSFFPVVSHFTMK